MQRIEVNVVTGAQTVIDLTTQEAAAAQAVSDAITAAEAPEKARVASLDGGIAADTTIATLKAMDNAAFNAWWAANVTNLAQANVVLKTIARVMLRKVL